MCIVGVLVSLASSIRQSRMDERNRRTVFTESEGSDRHSADSRSSGRSDTHNHHHHHNGYDNTSYSGGNRYNQQPYNRRRR